MYTPDRCFRKYINIREGVDKKIMITLPEAIIVYFCLVLFKYIFCNFPFNH